MLFQRTKGTQNVFCNFMATHPDMWDSLYNLCQFAASHTSSLPLFLVFIFIHLLSYMHNEKGIHTKV
jgi:hypothetical protein